MGANDLTDELHGAGRTERLRLLVESDEQAVLAHDRLEERVVCGDVGLHERRPCADVRRHGRRDAREQFGRGLAREREAQNSFGRHTGLDEVDDALRHREGLAGARARHDKHVVILRRADDALLLGAGNECRHG